MHLAADGPSQLATATAKRLKNATVRSFCGCQKDASPSAARVHDVRRLGGQTRGLPAGTSTCAQVVSPHERGLRRGAGFSNNTEAQAQRRRLPHTVRGALAPMPAIKSCRNSYRVPLLADACRRCWLPSFALRGTDDLAR